MERVKIDLAHCYGIKKLDAILDFSRTQAYAIYAPNGVMKSSLAETFRDAAEKRKTIDRIFPKRVSSRKITDEGGGEIERFDAIDKKLQRNEELREFCRYLQDNEPLLSRMNNPEKLMTPENIHLNAFMYEPLIDMSGHRLQELYAAVKGLT